MPFILEYLWPVPVPIRSERHRVRIDRQQGLRVTYGLPAERFSVYYEFEWGDAENNPFQKYKKYSASVCIQTWDKMGISLASLDVAWELTYRNFKIHLKQIPIFYDSQKLQHLVIVCCELYTYISHVYNYIHYVFSPIAINTWSPYNFTFYLMGQTRYAAYRNGQRDRYY